MANSNKVKISVQLTFTLRERSSFFFPDGLKRKPRFLLQKFIPVPNRPTKSIIFGHFDTVFKLTSTEVKRAFKIFG